MKATILEQVLDLARWAPSGDNTQPWRFEIAGEHHLVVHGFDTRSHCVYDLDGKPSQISIGALIETIAIAASAHGLGVAVSRREGLPETTPTFDIRFHADAAIAPSPLLEAVTRRAVQRRGMQSQPLTADEKSTLEQSVAPRFRIHWLEGSSTKWQVARLLFDNAKVRLTMPEAYEVHRSIIEWGAQFSTDRVPDAALGADAMTVKTMRFVMASWGRVEFFNRFMAGTVLPRIQMDLLPALACSAHYVLVDTQLPASIDDHVAAGRAVQRLWLTMTRQGLAQQPEMTPLIFGSYVRRNIPFTRVPQVSALAQRVAGRCRDVLGVDLDRAVWMGRVGRGPFATARSTRLSVDELRWTGPAAKAGHPAS
jgi:hypothetical protein